MVTIILYHSGEKIYIAKRNKSIVFNGFGHLTNAYVIIKIGAAIMYLHLGEKKVVNTKKIVAIIDIESATVSKITRDFLKSAQLGGIVTNVSDDLPRSAVVCESKGKKDVFISQISSGTLDKRRKGLCFETEYKNRYNLR